MTKTIIGSTYRIYLRRNFGKFVPTPVLVSSKNRSNPQPLFFVQNSTNNRLPSGRILLDTTKSSTSMIVDPGPNNWTPDHTLNPSTVGMDNTAMPTKLTVNAFRRSQPNTSMLMLMIFSNTAITVDNAAKDINTKKSIPHNVPLGIWLNTFGSVINSSDGPASGRIPKEIHAGITIIPATNAISVSNTNTLIASPVSLRSLPK